MAVADAILAVGGKVNLLRTLKTLWSSLPRLVRVAAVLCVLYWLASTALEWALERGCFHEVLATFPGISGYDFEVSVRECWHNPETGVFVSKPGRSKKALLFLYYSDQVPAIRSTGDQRIRISLDEVRTVLCQTERWDDLTIEYHIHSIRYPLDGVRECKGR